MLTFYEVLGQAILSTLNIKKVPFNFFIGFVFHIALLYITTSLFTAMNCSFKILLILNVIIFTFLIVFTLKNIKTIKLNFSYIQIIALLIMSGISLYFSYNTTLGDIHGFDSVYYLNLVVGPIGQNGVQNYNSIGGYGLASDASQQYFFQSYYYFCSVIVFIISKIFNILHISDFYSTIYIWLFQIIFTLSLMSVFINACSRYSKNDKLSTIVMLLFAVFGYSKLYWNSVFGFYGNSFKLIVISYISMTAIDYLNTREQSYKYLLAILILAGCSFTSTFIFIAIFFAIAFTFAIDDDEQIFKYYAVVFSLPICNLFCIVTKKPVYICLFVGILFALMMWFFNDYLIKLFKDKKTKTITALIIAVLMFILSRLVSDGLFDFSGLLDNLSERADMTLFYFSFNYYPFVKIITLLTAGIYIVIGFKDKYAIILMILLLCFFNPFCCNILNKINLVYYRAYDIIFNPFTFVYYCSFISNTVNNKKYILATEVILIFLTLANLNNYKINYYHESFKIPSKEKNYDHINKMSKYEVEVLEELKYIVYINNNNNLLICTPDIRTFSALSSGEYVYGRGLVDTICKEQNTCEVFKAFYPVEYYGEKIFKDIDYLKLIDYLEKSKVDILVIDKEQIYFDNSTGSYYPLYLFVENMLNPIFSNEGYAIYKID